MVRRRAKRSTGDQIAVVDPRGADLVLTAVVVDHPQPWERVDHSQPWERVVVDHPQPWEREIYVAHRLTADQHLAGVDYWAALQALRDMRRVGVFDGYRDPEHGFWWVDARVTCAPDFGVLVAAWIAEHSLGSGE